MRKRRPNCISSQSLQDRHSDVISKTNEMKFIRHTQYTKAKYTVYSKCDATGSSQRANAPLIGYPVTIQLEQSPVQHMKLRINTKTQKKHKNTRFHVTWITDDLTYIDV